MVAATGKVVVSSDYHSVSNNNWSLFKNMEQNNKSHIGLAFLSILVSSLLLTACGIDKNIKKGEKYLALGEYYDAADQFKQAYTKTPTKEREKRGQRALKMAYCYEKINATPKAVAAYRNAIRYGQANIQDRLSYARQLLKNGDYKIAQTEFKSILDSLPNEEMSKNGYDILARNGLKSAQAAPEWKKKGSRYTVKKMDIFNSRRADYSPMLFGDEVDQL